MRLINNVFKTVVESLGVKIGEEFKIMNVTTGEVRVMKYMFNDKRLVYRVNGLWERSDMLDKLVYGDYTIIKTPVKRQRYYRYGNEYYSYDSLGNIKKYVWEYTPLNNEHKRSGKTFDTYEEALAAKESVR